MHIQLTISLSDEETRAILMAELEEEGAEGFEESETSLLAYFRVSAFNEISVAEKLAKRGVVYDKKEIEETNWNALWESNFQPVSVDDFLYIRADFHPPAEGFAHELVITPKMSFGTGHHATTWLMANAMRKIDFSNKTVFDFGTGTGILAILASRLGAARVWAIDNDRWSIENGKENLTRNAVNNIDIQLADTFSKEGEAFDIILANINKNVILDHISRLASRLKKTGVLLLSGLLSTDEADIRLAASIQGLEITERNEKDNWLCLKASFSGTQ